MTNLAVEEISAMIENPVEGTSMMTWVLTLVIASLVIASLVVATLSHHHPLAILKEARLVYQRERITAVHLTNKIIQDG